MDRTGKYIDGTRQEKSRFGEPECGQTGGKKQRNFLTLKKNKYFLI